MADLIELQEFPSLETCAEVIAKDIGYCLQEALEKRGAATCAVSGGNTPRHILPLLAVRHLDWDRISVTLVDERWVAPDHPDSNEKLARDYLLKGPACKARFVALKTLAERPQDGVEEAAARLETLSWPLDAMFLGMGADGHIASLFPGEFSLDQTAGRCLAVPATEDRGARMSLSPGALLDCRRIFLVLSGAAKRARFEQALTPGSALELPLRLALLQDKVPVSAYWAPL